MGKYKDNITLVLAGLTAVVAVARFVKMVKDPEYRKGIKL